jgi:beta-galactosidase
MPRTIVPLNRDWSYAPAWRDEWKGRPMPKGAIPVDLPHSNLELPFNDFDERDYQFVSCYQRRLAVPKCPAGGGFAYLDFEGIASCAEVYVEGELAASHEGGYTPFSVPLAPWAGRESS